MPPREEPYEFGADNEVTSADFNRDAVRLRTDEEALRRFDAPGIEVTGELQLPLVTLHSTGDGQVPIDQARVLRERVDAAGSGDLLVTRVIQDASHCGFSTGEQEAALAALVEWVERGEKPDGTNLAVDDFADLDQTFELLPRDGLPGADEVIGFDERVVVSGGASLDGDAFDARWIGAVVQRDGLVTPCQHSLPPVDGGRYEIPVLAEAEASGCGGPGSEILLWTFVGGQKLWSTGATEWPATGTTTTFEPQFLTSEPMGAASPTTDFSGDVYGSDGERLPPGTRIEAFVGDTRCGVASVRHTSYAGYILSVVGPDQVDGCRSGADLTFQIDGQPTLETRVHTPDQSGQLDLTVK